MEMILPGLSKMPSLNGTSDLRGTPSIVGMNQWLAKLGYIVIRTIHNAD
jgi:hypothetical protein